MFSKILSFLFGDKNKSTSAYQYSFNGIDGEEILLSDYKDKVLLVVNTACKCGFTKQIGEMERLYQKYKEQGFEVLAVSSNDFGGQEFDSSEEVDEFTKKNFARTFPITETTHVKGNEAHPFYKWAAQYAGITGTPKWNFHKYLINKNGEFVEWFSSTTSPFAENIIQDIEAELKK